MRKRIAMALVAVIAALLLSAKPSVALTLRCDAVIDKPVPVAGNYDFVINVGDILTEEWHVVYTVHRHSDTEPNKFRGSAVTGASANFSKPASPVNNKYSSSVTLFIGSVCRQLHPRDPTTGSYAADWQAQAPGPAFVSLQCSLGVEGQSPLTSDMDTRDGLIQMPMGGGG